MDLVAPGSRGPDIIIGVTTFNATDALEIRTEFCRGHGYLVSQVHSLGD